MTRGRLRLLFLLTILFCCHRLALATEVLPPAAEADETQPGEEDPDSGILPPNAGLAPSTTTITPTTEFPEKAPYDQARDELAQAEVLQAKGSLEAASDTALEAYEDLLQIRRPRGPLRKKLHAERKQAATVYIDAGIAFITNWVKDHGGGPQAVKEGIGRLDDLRDVARDFEDLNRRLTRAIEQAAEKK